MSDAKFNLWSWASNSPRLTEQTKCSTPMLPVDLLGLKWNTHTDTVSLTQCQMNQEATTPVTKQTILQSSSKQYDPLGWLSPITVRAKLLIQELWKQQVGWDEPLDDDFNRRWCQVAVDIEEGAKTLLTCRYSVMSTSQCVFLYMYLRMRA